MEWSGWHLRHKKLYSPQPIIFYHSLPLSAMRRCACLIQSCALALASFKSSPCLRRPSLLAHLFSRAAGTYETYRLSCLPFVHVCLSRLPCPVCPICPVLLKGRSFFPSTVPLRAFPLITPPQYVGHS